MKWFKYKIFTLRPPVVPVDTIGDWQSEDYPLFEYTDNLVQALAQPYKIAAIPIGYNIPGRFAYNADLAGIDFTQFDLVIFSEIEKVTLSEIKQTMPAVDNYLVAKGCFEYDLPDNVIYRPWWMFRHTELNGKTKRPIDYHGKEFLFEALLGQKRLHRSFVMAKFQKNPQLLNKSIVTYRDVFGVDDFHMKVPLQDDILQILDGEELAWPYVSQNLTSGLEVHNPYSDQISNQISEITPWKIYDKTWYSIVCETDWHNPVPNMQDPSIDTPGPFFISEKIAKVMLGQRLFVMFGPMHILKFLKEQGFKTFDSVIDESYDNQDNICKRFTQAFEQVEYLATCDPVDIMKKTEQIRQYNWEHLYEYRHTKKNQMTRLILDKIPAQYLSSDAYKLPAVKNGELIRTTWSR
tara:strand:+ start:53 stop:1273 length:1221 start_codon:yes stop_codon:yes gene_type:complete